jgi:hypothetical protein
MCLLIYLHAKPYAFAATMVAPVIAAKHPKKYKIGIVIIMIKQQVHNRGNITINAIVPPVSLLIELGV